MKPETLDATICVRLNRKEFNALVRTNPRLSTSDLIRLAINFYVENRKVVSKAVHK